MHKENCNIYHTKKLKNYSVPKNISNVVNNLHENKDEIRKKNVESNI
jgi:hypothetical protein